MVQRLEVDEVSVEKRVFIVPLHLNSNSRQRLLQGAESEHVDLVAPDLGDGSHIPLKPKGLLNGYVLLTPDGLLIFLLVRQ